jgi:large subunit ribosomal protein L25
MTELLSVADRDQSGKRTNKRLRRTGFIPGTVYGRGIDGGQKISLEHKKFMKLIETNHDNEIINLKFDDEKTIQAILQEKQYHPYKNEILHVDFLVVSKNRKITTKVSITLVNEGTCEGIKMGGLLLQQINEVDVEFLPADLPETIIVDVAELKIDNSIHLSDLTLPKGVEFTHEIEAKSSYDQPVVSVHKKKETSDTTTSNEGEEGKEESSKETKD